MPAAAIFLMLLSTAVVAETPALTIASPKGEFQLAYPSSLVQCTREPAPAADPSSWVPDSWCRNYVCEDLDSPSTITVACFAFVGDAFSGKVAFGAGALFIAEVANAATASSCLQGDSGWNVQSKGEARIAALPAAQFRTVDNWMMHSRDSDIYRIFHRAKCYEIGIQRVQNSTAPYDPGTFKEFTARDEATVQRGLRQALLSLRFLPTDQGRAQSK